MKKSVRGRLEDKHPNPVDVHVGNRIRLRRRILGITQEKFAGKIGITLQQVQKYEHGTNRVGASRLWDIAQVLHTSVDYFFEDMDDKEADLMKKNETLTLLAAYYKIKNRQIAEYLLNFLKELAK